MFCEGKEATRDEVSTKQTELFFKFMLLSRRVYIAKYQLNKAHRAHSLAEEEHTTAEKQERKSLKKMKKALRRFNEVINSEDLSLYGKAHKKYIRAEKRHSEAKKNLQKAEKRFKNKGTSLKDKKREYLESKHFLEIKDKIYSTLFFKPSKRVIKNHTKREHRLGN